MHPAGKHQQVINALEKPFELSPEIIVTLHKVYEKPSPWQTVGHDDTGSLMGLDVYVYPSFRLKQGVAVNLGELEQTIAKTHAKAQELIAHVELLRKEAVDAQSKAKSGVEGLAAEKKRQSEDCKQQAALLKTKLNLSSFYSPEQLLGFQAEIKLLEERAENLKKEAGQSAARSDDQFELKCELLGDIAERANNLRLECSLKDLVARLLVEGNDLSLEDLPNGFSSDLRMEYAVKIAHLCFQRLEARLPFKPDLKDSGYGHLETLYFDEEERRRMWLRLMPSFGFLSQIQADDSSKWNNVYQPVNGKSLRKAVNPSTVIHALVKEGGWEFLEPVIVQEGRTQVVLLFAYPAKSVNKTFREIFENLTEKGVFGRISYSSDLALLKISTRNSEPHMHLHLCPRKDLASRKRVEQMTQAHRD